MTADKKRRVEKTGWKVGSVSDFLSLSPEEAACVKLKVQLVKALRTRRQRLGISQVEVAKRLRSSQSRVAKMEAGRSYGIDRSVGKVRACAGRWSLDCSRGHCRQLGTHTPGSRGKSISKKGQWKYIEKRAGGKERCYPRREAIVLPMSGAVLAYCHLRADVRITPINRSDIYRRLKQPLWLVLRQHVDWPDRCV